MKSKLYYQDAYIKEFTTKGIHQQQDENGNWYVVLSETAFYPTGGGQPFDKGTLNGVQVVNVEEVEGEIRHYLEEPLPDLDTIAGVIDWNRRFDHMQQHSGQHILTASFVELFGANTVSFHLGEETSTIDLHIENLTEQMSLEAEKRANQMILENRPIETKWVTEEEISHYKLRKQLSVTENIRLVIISDFDYNGCGGTHPRSTGEVSSIKILNWDRQKKDLIRVQFVCGNRVLEQLHKKQKVLLALSPLLSSPEQEMTNAVTRLLENEKEFKKTVEELSDNLLHYEGKELLGSVTDWNGNKVVTKVFQNRTIQQLQKLGKMIATEDQTVNVFFANENGPQLQFVGTRGSLAIINMKSVVQQLLPLINGRGGGNESTAQGGGAASISGEGLLKKVEEMI